MDTILLFVGGLGGWEIFLILAIIMVFFGAKKIPQIAKGMGQGIREYKSAISGLDEKETKDS
ncbi:twin-arginine translocase TatA/TatE family subunit [Porifericola rhodea]|uniref:twin-arginine translocase TatA/TatE family subunit n=1 Tax=Porifericola rhodea TaxID=930972 RepID=UPI00266694A9|nr:twin-arginine translocase TatA/TatE family subunit [Porifericola rhodea]WKN33394.1 twin-arginine translocase TatA/TatE family subunit [Porifericola rhodea]